MNVRSTESKGTAIVAITGEVDMHSSPKLRDALIELTGSKAPAIVVDFTGVTYMDSSGIATCVECLRAVKAYGGSLRLAALNGAIMEIFTFAKLDMVFEIHDTVQDALKA